jgi:pyruvate dehydrogenase E1 component alpha subunit
LLRDPVVIYRERLLKLGFNEPTLKDMEAEAMGRVDAATATAKASPLPSIDDIEKNVWVDGGSAWRN